MAPNKKIEVKCPQCEKKFLYYDSEFRPFCSEKCQQIDLGHWINESYTVPVVDTSDILLDQEDEETEN